MRKYIQDMALIATKVSIRMGTNIQGGHSLFLTHPVCMIVEGSTLNVVCKFYSLETILIIYIQQKLN